MKSRKIVKRKTIKLADTHSEPVSEAVVALAPVEQAPRDTEFELHAMRRVEEERRRLALENKLAAEEAAEALAIAERLRKEALDREHMARAEVEEQKTEIELREAALLAQQERMDADMRSLAMEKERFDEEKRLAAVSSLDPKKEFSVQTPALVGTLPAGPAVKELPPAAMVAISSLEPKIARGEPEPEAPSSPPRLPPFDGATVDVAAAPPGDGVSAVDILEEVRRAAAEAEAAAADFEKQLAMRSRPLPIAETPVEDAIESRAPEDVEPEREVVETALRERKDAQDHSLAVPDAQPAAYPTEETQSGPSKLSAASLRQLDADARKRAISEKLKLLRAIDGVLYGEEDSEEPKATEAVATVAEIPTTEVESTPAPMSSAPAAPEPVVVSPPAESTAPERWKQLEEDLRRMREEQEQLQAEAFDAEKQRRGLQAESEAMRILEEARKKRVELEEEELVRRAVEEEARREQERLQLEAELSLARGFASRSTLTEQEKQARLSEDREAEATKIRLQQEIQNSIESTRRYSRASASPSPPGSQPLSRRTSSSSSPETLTRSRLVSDADASVGVLLGTDGEPEPVVNEFEPRDPKRRALSFVKPYDYDDVVLMPNGAAPPPKTTGLAAQPISAGKTPTGSHVPTMAFSEYSNPDGLSTSYLSSGRTPRDGDELVGSMLDPSLREKVSPREAAAPGVAGVQMQRRLDAAKRTVVQQQRADAMSQTSSSSSSSSDDAKAGKGNFTLEDFLSGELDGLEEDTSTSTAPTSLLLPEVEEVVRFCNNLTF